MNNISDFEAHQRDEAFDRADAKSRHVSHADRVAFADAMLKAVEDLDAPCPACEGSGLVSIEGEGDIIEALCGECNGKNAEANR
jgi:hypothetical protein